MSIRYEKRTILNRKLYKNIKKYDREQMESYLVNLYMEGYEDGRNDVPGVDISVIKEIVMNVKGVGEKRAEEIVRKIKERMKG